MIKRYIKCRKISQKSPQVVKHVVKGEKWACSTLKVVSSPRKNFMFVETIIEYIKTIKISTLDRDVLV